MPIMTIGTNNLEEDVASMKATLEKLVKENEENEVCIRLQEEKIVRLTRKLEKAFVQSEASDEEVYLKKGSTLKNDGFPSLMTVEQIQDLIANSIKAQLGGGAENSPLYQVVHQES